MLRRIKMKTKKSKLRVKQKRVIKKMANWCKKKKPKRVASRGQSLSRTLKRVAGIGCSFILSGHLSIKRLICCTIFGCQFGSMQFPTIAIYMAH